MASFCLKFSSLLKAIPKIKYTPTSSYSNDTIDQLIKDETEALRKIHATKDDESIVVAHLPCIVTKSDLHSYFSTFGKILYIKYPYQPNGLPSKVAEIKFEDCNTPRTFSDLHHKLLDQKIKVYLPKYMPQQSRKGEKQYPALKAYTKEPSDSVESSSGSVESIFEH